MEDFAEISPNIRGVSGGKSRSYPQQQCAQPQYGNQQQFSQQQYHPQQQGQQYEPPVPPQPYGKSWLGHDGEAQDKNIMDTFNNNKTLVMCIAIIVVVLIITIAYLATKDSSKDGMKPVRTAPGRAGGGQPVQQQRRPLMQPAPEQYPGSQHNPRDRDAAMARANHSRMQANNRMEESSDDDSDYENLRQRQLKKPSKPNKTKKPSKKSTKKEKLPESDDDDEGIYSDDNNVEEQVEPDVEDIEDEVDEGEADESDGEADEAGDVDEDDEDDEDIDGEVEALMNLVGKKNDKQKAKDELLTIPKYVKTEAAKISGDADDEKVKRLLTQENITVSNLIKLQKTCELPQLKKFAATKKCQAAIKDATK